jgi:hypothetical protein
MTKTIKVLYDTRADAELGREALKAAGLGDHVEILDKVSSDHTGEHLFEVLTDKLLALFGELHEYETYVEGLRRGHFLMIVKVGEFQETRAAEILDATAPGPINLSEAKTTWHAEGWKAAAAGGA